MAVQQNKVSRSRRNKRRSHDALAAAKIEECSDCGEMKLPHHVCPVCGFYKGAQILRAEEEVDDEDVG